MTNWPVIPLDAPGTPIRKGGVINEAMSLNSKAEPAQQMGPRAYENWKASLAGVLSKRALEHQLFTDVHITGELQTGYGPYQLLNAVAIPEAQSLFPAIVLRMEYHLQDDSSENAMVETSVDRYHGGGLTDEIAALLSLSLGFRLRAGPLTRISDAGGDPRGRPFAFAGHETPVLLKPVGRAPVLPSLTGIRLLNDDAFLAKLPHLSPENAGAVVRASRPYQDAIWIAESAPELAWIMLVSALETAASHWHHSKDSAVDRLRASRPELEKILLEAGGEKHVNEVANQIADYMGATKTFTDFVMHFVQGPPEHRPLERAQVSWGNGNLRAAMKKIYAWRSRALHAGTPFPRPMCMPPMKVGTVFSEKPVGMATAAQGGVWLAEDTPILLHTFEYIVRSTLLPWWRSMLPENIPGAGQSH